MNKKTIEALWQSIEHYYENWLDPRTACVYGDSCPLCYRFGTHCHTRNERCPIYKSTGQTECRGTPWISVRNTVDYYQNAVLKDEELVVRRAALANAKHALVTEYQYLIDLLPDPPND